MTGLLERKLVTALFADLVGATGLAERLDVEQFHDITQMYFAAVRHEIEVCGGTVGQFVGDAVLGLFGVPAAHEDDVDRALSAASRMLDRLRDLNEDLDAVYGLRLSIRVGINTGRLLVPASGPVDPGTVTGDTTNVAARLHELAGPGEVLVADRSVRASRRFLFEDRGETTLRGRKRPIGVAALAGERAISQRRTSLQSDLVGRVEEMSSLLGALDEMRVDLRPRIVTIIGAAGIGKSRLVAEFLDRVEVADSPVVVVRGRCLPFGEERSYRPLASILRSQAGLIDDDPAAVVLEKIRKTLHSPPAPTPSGNDHRSAALLAHTLGFEDVNGAVDDLSPVQISREIRSAWKTFFSRLADSTPAIAVIEDVHWADAALLDLLEGLGETVAAPVMFLCTARPSLLEGDLEWGGARIHSRIGLNAMSRNESREFVMRLLGTDTLPAEIGEQVLDRAEGNPFFVEEILRHLIDRCCIVPVGFAWGIGPSAGSFTIPDTVQSVLAARIDLLGAGEKRVLQCAAVIGRVFWAGAVAALAGMAEDEVLSIIDLLGDRDMIRIGTATSLGGRQEYLFKHILIGEVAYDGLGRRERAALHDEAYTWIERVAGASHDVCDLLAHHAARSYEEVRHDPGTPRGVRTKRRTRALHRLLDASADARRSMVLDKAKELARRALDLAGDVAEQARAHTALGEVALLGRWGDEAWDHHRQAIDLCLDDPAALDCDLAGLCARALETPVRWPGTMLAPPPESDVRHYLAIGFDRAGPGDSPQRARLLALESFWQHAYGGDATRERLVSPDRSLAAGQEGAAMARRLGRPDIESVALDGVAANWIPRGEYRRALEATARRTELMADIHDPWELGDVHAMQGWVNYHLGRYRDVVGHADTGFALSRDEAPGVAIHCLTWRALAQFRLAAWGEALADLDLARYMLGDRREEPPHYVSPMFAAGALIHELRGETGDADAILEMLVDLQELSGPHDRDALPLARWASFTAPLLARRGRFDDARRLIALTRWRRGTRLGMLLHARCEVALEEADWGVASDVAAAARAHASAVGLEALPAMADLLDGTAHAGHGRADEGAGLLRRAADAFDRLGARWDAARARLALAESLLDVNRNGEARRAATAASDVFAGIGVRPELDRAAAVLRRA